MCKICDFEQNRKRLDAAIKDTESKQDTYKDSLGKLQQQLQQAKLKATMK